MSREHYKSTSSMLDLFLLLAMGFVVLFVLAFILIKPVDPKDKDVDLDEHMLIKLEWNDEARSDIDLWLMLPNEQIVSFKSQHHMAAALERDDRGSVSDLINVNGEDQWIRDNTEVIRIKRLEDGVYYVSTQYYSNTFCSKCTEEEFTVTVHDGQKHVDLAIMTGTVYKYAETPVMRITVKDGKPISYEKSDRFFAVVKNSGSP